MLFPHEVPQIATRAKLAKLHFFPFPSSLFCKAAYSDFEKYSSIFGDIGLQPFSVMT